jgi:hypothetical protein
MRCAASGVLNVRLVFSATLVVGVVTWGRLSSHSPRFYLAGRRFSANWGLQGQDVGAAAISARSTVAAARVGSIPDTAQA